MFPAVIKVDPLPDYQLKPRFEDGKEKIFIMKPYLNQGVFQELKNEHLFKTVRVSFDSITWSNGADLCPEVLD